MAIATATITVNAYPKGMTQDERFVYVYGTIAVQASPATYATGGLALSFVGVGSASEGAFSILPDYAVPIVCSIYSVAGGTFPYSWNQASNKLQIFAASAGVAGTAPFVELANALAIPAAVSGDTIAFEAVFPKN